MSLKWKFYFGAALLNIIGSAGAIAIGLYVDITGHTFLDSFEDVFAYVACILFCLKSIVNIIFIQKYKINALISKTAKVIFYILFCFTILIVLFLVSGIIYSLSQINFNNPKASTIIANLFLFTLASTCIYCLILDIPLLKKIDQQRNLVQQLETIGTQEINI